VTEKVDERQADGGEVSAVGFAVLSENRWGKFGLRVLALTILLGTWQWVGDDSVALLFPTFTRTLDAFINLVSDGTLFSALIITNQTLVAGFILAVGIGIPVGVLSARVPLIDRTISPYFTLLVAIPIIALIPVVQALLGLTFSARVTVVVLFAIPYIVINTRVAVRTVDPVLMEMSSSFGAGGLRSMTDVIFPAAVPGIMAGVRIGLGQALIGMVVAELTIVGAGIGSLIMEMQGRFRVAPVLAIALTVVIEGILLMSIAEWIEQRLSRWRSS
jgi:ABC-type nitrate/sulfonate/bicarbonate transport system permease component